MNYRALMVVCLFMVVAVVFAPAMAQGVKANKGVVVESVDEDVVEGDASAVDKNTVKDSAVHKDAATDKRNAADSSAAHKKTPVKKELDLDALLGGDDEEDLLVEEEKHITPVVVDSASADTSAVKSSELVGDEKTPAPDSVAQAVHGRRGGRHSSPKTAAKADTANLGPVVIEDGRSINFAHNLKEYRSPRIAMLLSLLVPGLGQAYSRSYIKAGAFGAVELATIGVAVYFNVMGKAKYEEAKDFADAHYNINKMKDYDDMLWKEFQKRGLADSVRATTEKFPQYYDTSFYNAAYNKESYFYESIREIYFTPGWDDNEPPLKDVLTLSGTGSDKDTLTGKGGSKYFLSFNVADSSNAAYFYWLTRMVGGSVREERVLGYSSRQAEYNAMMDKSNSYYNAVNYTFYVLLLNHIASAIDAGFTARAYNAKLLGQESVWNRLSVEQTYVYTGSEVSPGLALGWRF